MFTFYNAHFPKEWMEKVFNTTSCIRIYSLYLCTYPSEAVFFLFIPLRLKVSAYVQGVSKKMVIELWSALARSLYNLQKSFFDSRKDQAFSFRMSPFL